MLTLATPPFPIILCKMKSKKHLIKPPILLLAQFTLRSQFSVDAVPVHFLLSTLLPLLDKPDDLSNHRKQADVELGITHSIYQTRNGTGMILHEWIQKIINRLFSRDIVSMASSSLHQQDDTTVTSPGATGVHGFEVEVSIHKCPRSFTDEMKRIFPELCVILDEDNPIKVIPTFQKTVETLLVEGSGKQGIVDAIKDMALENFCILALYFCTILRVKYGFWADFCDPCSGLCVMDRNVHPNAMDLYSAIPTKDKLFPTIQTGIYSEVEGAVKLLGYDGGMRVGCCRVIRHPK